MSESEQTVKKEEPAFPCVIKASDILQHEGITMRDYFAAKAMQSQIVVLEGMEGCEKEMICAMAYELADQMLIERKRKKS